jgi:type II secretory pathway component PulJ
MIALAISGIVVTCLFAVYDRTLEVGEQVKKQAGVEQNARMIFSRLHKDLEGLYYRRSQNASSPGPYSFSAGGLPGGGGHLERDGVILMSFGSTTSLDFREASFPERRLFRVRYILRKSGHKERGAGTLLRSQLAFPAIREEPSRVTLSERVSDISATFVGASGREQTSWNSAARTARDGKHPLPTSVRVELTLRSGEGTKRTYVMRFALEGSGGDYDG